MKTALVVGSAGQDGQLLTAELVDNGWGVLGVDLNGVTQTVPLLPAFEELDLLDRAAVDACIAGLQPSAVFYLAALHHSSEESTRGDTALLFEKSYQVHVRGWLHVLDALERLHPEGRAFYAASSHVFGEPPSARQDESTPFAPTSVYAMTKVLGVELGRLYRRNGLHISSGYLYNHESPLRGPKFVSQRIVRGAVAAAKAHGEGRPFQLELGSLKAVVDWGWAADYVHAMRLIVEQVRPDDYVVASGVAHTTGDFCRTAFGLLGLDFTKFVTEREGRLERVVPPLVGDASSLRRVTGWNPSVTFEVMVKRLVDAEIGRVAAET